MLARTALGRPTRVLLAGHLDTVPVADNLPSRRSFGDDGELLHGCGTVDMKSGDAVFLHLAATLDAPAHDLTLVFYDCEEIEAAANGLGRIERDLPDWLRADVAILGEPSGGYIEAGCQGHAARGDPRRRRLAPRHPVGARPVAGRGRRGSDHVPAGAGFAGRYRYRADRRRRGGAGRR
ncbi:Putative succinyl-diaminopimelate desuccinylase DapE [Mycobacterium talmoniae]|uniref:Succinyl-diaminopimelate desuccinylase DapE n=1 Tax=Mycobacterium talmoniae TaxID=1858794 RepID=A0A2S8BGD9_9MYCO|nr:Putative succinyl-diaminopimelate desuccinylase DapE [Mycobacterium talmoniae]